MKIMPKKIIIYSLILFLFLLYADLVLAEGPAIKIPEIKIPIPGMSQLQAPQPCKSGEANCYEIPWIAQYIGGLYKFGVSVLAILSVVVIAWGGIVWLTAGGSATQVTKAKEHILGGITGLILGLSSYIILATLNPDLVNLKPIRIITIAREEAITVSKCSWKPKVTEGTNECGAGFHKGVGNQCPSPTNEEQEKGYICCCPETCPAAQSGPCSTAEMEKHYFSGDTAYKASAICLKESSGVTNARNTTAVCKNQADGQLYSVVWGLFQINISANKLYSSELSYLDCPKAFNHSYAYSQPDCLITDFDLYAKCWQQAIDPSVNIYSAYIISNHGSKWSPWEANNVFNCNF